KTAVETAVKWRSKKKALSIGTVRIKHFLAQKLALGTLWGGRSSPPDFPNSKFFPKIFQRYRSANQDRTFLKKGTPKTFHSPLRRQERSLWSPSCVSSFWVLFIAVNSLKPQRDAKRAY
ncbi:TPA: hypothetical protein ACXJTX_002844, partial [Enterococcus faecium]